MTCVLIKSLWSIAVAQWSPVDPGEVRRAIFSVLGKFNCGELEARTNHIALQPVGEQMLRLGWTYAIPNPGLWPTSARFGRYGPGPDPPRATHPAHHSVLDLARA